MNQNLYRSPAPRAGSEQVYSGGDHETSLRVRRVSTQSRQAAYKRRYTSVMPRTFAYSVLDVFAERALEGNPLAVFHDARGLSDAEMQALARETNLAETTFIFPEDDPAREAEEGVRVRIFTTQEELPFAGHPTLGTASWLYFHHPVLRGAEHVTLRLNVGSIPVRFTPQQSGQAGVFGTMQQNDPVFGREHDPAEVARALGLPLDDLSPDHRPQTVSTGIPFCIVPLRSLEVSGRLAIPQREASAWLAAHESQAARTGTTACSSTPAKTRPPAPLRAAASRGSCATGSRLRQNPSSSSREPKFGARAGLLRRLLWIRSTEPSVPFWYPGAPSPWQTARISFPSFGLIHSGRNHERQ